MTRGGAGSDGVALVVEQLRRPVPGGIGTYSRELARALGARPAGSEPAVWLHASATLRRPDPLGSLGLPLSCSLLPAPLLVRAWERGHRRVRGASLVHACSLAAPAPGPPLVVTVHDLAWRDEPAPSRRRTSWHESALRRVARQARHVVVPSQATAEALLESGAGLAPDQVSVIEEGSDHLPPPDRAAAQRLLASLGVRPPFLLAVGTLEPRKNLARLVQAYGLARGELPEPWPLVIAGPAGWGPGLAPAGGVVLAGRVEDAVLAALYAEARLCCYVPLCEGFGLPAVEAMAAGTPVVSSAVPSAGGASLLVDPLEPASIASGLLAGATDEAVRHELAGRGLVRAAGLTWSRAARAHAELWRRVIAEAS